MAGETETADNVTFVGGRAVEQHDAGDTPDGAHGDELAAAKEAVRKALAKEAGEEGAKTAKKSKDSDAYTPPGMKRGKSDDEEAPASEKAKPKAKAKEGPGDEPAEDSEEAKAVKHVLKQREKLAKAKQQQNNEFQQQQQQLQQQWAQIQAENARIQREKERLLALKKDPARAVREAGWDPEEFILDLARDGTPEGQQARLLRELKEQQAQMLQWKEEQAQAQRQAQEQYQMQRMVQARQNIEKTFTDGAMNGEKYPHLAAFYKGREHALIAEGDLVAAQYREASGGNECSLEQIADYIEEQLAERANAWYESKSASKKLANGAQEVAAPEGKGKPAQGGSRGKALTGSVASERRALGRDLSDLDGEERLLAAREAVKVAMSSSRDE